MHEVGGLLTGGGVPVPPNQAALWIIDLSTQFRGGFSQNIFGLPENSAVRFLARPGVQKSGGGP
jgi:hypothetical protein